VINFYICQTPATCLHQFLNSYNNLTYLCCNCANGNFGGTLHVTGDNDNGMNPSVKNSSAEIWLSVGRFRGSRVSRRLMRLRAHIDTNGGITNLLVTIRMYVSFRVVVSKGGRPHSNAYLDKRMNIHRQFNKTLSSKVWSHIDLFL